MTEQPKAELAPAPPPSTSNALAKRGETVKNMLESFRPQIAAALPRHISADRMLRVALTEGQRPEILKCAVGSFIGAVLMSAQLGLELGSSLGQAYLVPFWNKKTKRDEVQLIPGYRGLVHLVRQTGKVDKFAAHVVYARDTFDISFGIIDTLVHRPFIAKPSMKKKSPGPVIGAYAIVGFKSGTPQFEWMSLEDLEAIRQRSKAKDAGPWMTDTNEMYRKTVARRLSKWLPMSIELATALELDNRHEAGEPQVLPEVHITSLPAVAMIEAPDPVIEAYGVGGEDVVTDSAPAGLNRKDLEEDARAYDLAEEEAGKEPTEQHVADVKAEGRFRNLLASYDEASDVGELEVAQSKALKVAGGRKDWEKEAEDKFMAIRTTRFGNVKD